MSCFHWNIKVKQIISNLMDIPRTVDFVFRTRPVLSFDARSVLNFDARPVLDKSERFESMKSVADAAHQAVVQIAICKNNEKSYFNISKVYRN
jgi:hypothetical protein